MNKINFAFRKKARRLCLQALYQWQIAKTPAAEIVSQFMADNNMEKVDIEYFKELLLGVVKHTVEIDEKMLPILDRSIAELNPVELAVLRLAIYEFMYRLDVPYRVVINEALEMAKTYGAVEGYKYVNGVLDKLAPKLRALEQNVKNA